VNTGKTLFAQLMDFLPWSTFTRIVARYGGDVRVRTLYCTEQYRAMAFAQLTYRESLRDIEVCLSAQASKLYHMGFREPVRRSTLADANDFLRHHLQENADPTGTFRNEKHTRGTPNQQPAEFIRLLTGQQ